jgi:phage terminase large subunit-like protein
VYEWADFIHELTQFPACRYDDQFDSTAQALVCTKQRPAFTRSTGSASA